MADNIMHSAIDTPKGIGVKQFSDIQPTYAEVQNVAQYNTRLKWCPKYVIF